MRLVSVGDNSFEVHSKGAKVGRVWLYKGAWHGMTNNGEPATPGLPGETAAMIGMEVEKLHQRGY